MIATVDRFLKSDEPRACGIFAANRQIPFFRGAEIVAGSNRLYNICHSVCPAQRAETKVT
jgi:hypothetical protein